MPSLLIVRLKHEVHAQRFVRVIYDWRLARVIDDENQIIDELYWNRISTKNLVDRLSDLQSGRITPEARTLMERFPDAEKDSLGVISYSEWPELSDEEIKKFIEASTRLAKRGVAESSGDIDRRMDMLVSANNELRSSWTTLEARCIEWTGLFLSDLDLDEQRKKIPEKHDLWIDIGAVSGKEAKKHVSIGDPVTYDTNFEMLRNEMIVSRATDNKAGAWVVAEAMRRVASSKKKPKAALYSGATVQEEIGLRGAKTSAYGIDPLIGIAVDVTWAPAHPGIDNRKTGECVLGAGPGINRGANINPIVFDRLVSIAKNKKIPFQIA